MIKLWQVADFRCSDCNKLLMKQAIAKGRVELKCPRCNRINTFSTGVEIDEETSRTAQLVDNHWYSN